MTSDARRLPPGMTPRLLGIDAAAAYCGISAPHFRNHVQPQVRPVNIGTKELYDVRALDRWLDRQSGIEQPLRSNEEWLEALDGGAPLERH